jgi:predicted O-methyltransferase YrrM
MSNQTLSITQEIYDYILAVSLREHETMKALRTETMQLPESEMQISPEQGQFMQMLVKLINARRTIEVGVFTGYSSLAVALALPDDGHIVACDVSEEWTTIARHYWSRAGISHKIDLRLAPAADTLHHLLEAGQADSFDFAFIDADKPSYETYYELCLKLLRQGGLIMLDNTLWEGKVVDKNLVDPNLNAIQAINKKLFADDRIDLCLLPISDGISLARKK